MNNGSRILVTGGTGLVGAHLLLDLVRKGYHVRALKRPGSRIEVPRTIFSYYRDEQLFNNIEWAEGDILDPVSVNDAMQDMEMVLHSAALISMNPSDREEVLRTNVEGTRHVVNAALEKGIRKFGHISSVAALGIPVKRTTILESTPWNGAAEFSAYSHSKYLSENEVWRGIQEGLNAIIVNPSVVIGPGNWLRSSGDIFLGARRGYRWYTEGGIGYVDVRDVAAATLALLESDLVNQAFILSAENHTYRELMDMIYTELSQSLPNKRAGRLILELGWRMDKLKSMLTGRRHVLTREIARYSTMKLDYSHARITEALGFKFRPLRESIRETAQHFLEFEKKK